MCANLYDAIHYGVVIILVHRMLDARKSFYRHSSTSRLGFDTNGKVDMECIYRYKTPDGFDDLLLSSDGATLTGVWFEGSQDAAKHQRRKYRK